MASNMSHSVLDVRSMLDELFQIRMALAALPQERDAAIMRVLQPEVQEIVGAIILEFVDTQEQREHEEKNLAGEIRIAGKTLGIPIVGTYLQTTYDVGRRSWDSDGLEQLAERVPEVLLYRRQGEPVVQIRVRAQRRRLTPLMYDRRNL